MIQDDLFSEMNSLHQSSEKFQRPSLWTQLAIFFKLNIWHLRLRSKDFCFQYIIPIALITIYMAIDSNTGGTTAESKSPKINEIGSGIEYIQTMAIQFGNNSVLGVSPEKSDISKLLNEKYNFTLYQNLNQMVERIHDKEPFPSIGYTFEKENEIKIIPMMTDSASPIAFLSEVLVPLKSPIKKFSWSQVGFPHPPLEMYNGLTAIVAMYILIAWEIFMAGSSLPFNQLRKEKIIFMLQLDRMRDSVYYISIAITGLIEGIFHTAIASIVALTINPTIKGTDPLIVILMLYLFYMCLWMFSMTFSSFFKSEQGGYIVMLIVFILEAGVIMLYMFLYQFPIAVIKLIMALFPSGFLHGLIMLFDHMKNFYGSANWSNVNTRYYFTMTECFLYGLLDLVIWTFVFVVIALCKNRDYGQPPLGWKGIFSKRKWMNLFSKEKRTSVGCMSDTISISGLTKTYNGEEKKEIKALSNFSADINNGEVIILIGPNGSGKSTLIHSIVGFVKVDSGSIIINGDEIINNYESLYKSLGFVPQENALIRQLSVKEHMELFASMHGVPKNKLEDEINMIASHFGVSDFMNQKAADLSGGQKRKLMCALALLQRPDILILDEPTAGVDVQSRALIWKALGACKNTTTIVSAHSLEEAEAVCSRIFVMLSGELKFSGTPAELRVQTGCGYVLTPSGSVDMDKCLETSRSIVPEAKLSENGKSIHFPVDERAPDVIVRLVEEKENLGASDFSIHVQNLEDNLLNFVQENETN